MTAEAVIFDVDGTLLTLDVDIASVRRRLSALFGERGYRGEFRPVLQRIAEAAAQVARDADEQVDWIARGRAVIDEAEVAAAKRATARPGAQGVLEALRARAVPLGLVTDNGRACLAAAFASAGLGALTGFGAVVTRDDVARGKPDPEGVATAARALLPVGGRAWVVGDSPRDVEAAQHARAALPDIELTMVAVTGGRADAADLVVAAPDVVVDELGELLRLLA